MRFPKIILSIDPDDGLLIEKVEHTGSSPRLIIDVTMEELQAESSEEICRKIGGTIMGLFHVWYPDLLPKFQAKPRTEE